MHNAGLLYMCLLKGWHIIEHVSKERTHLTNTYFESKPYKDGDIIILKALAHIKKAYYILGNLLYRC